MPSRNSHYDPKWTPFGNDKKLAYSEGSAKGAVRWLNPTQSRFTGVPHTSAAQELQDDTLPPGTEYNYNSRDARKGRHTLVIDPTNYQNKNLILPSPTNSPKAVLKTIGKMFTTFPLGNLSWWEAIVFTIGSIVYIVTSFFTFMPLEDADVKQKYPQMSTQYGGYCAFVGSLIFAGGSVLMMLEAVNERRTATFGYAIHKEMDDQDPEFAGRTRFVPTKSKMHNELKQAWIWWPTWQEFKEHYLRELGFLACIVQTFSAAIFLWSNICAIPAVYQRISSSTVKLNCLFWLPKVLGCAGFVFSGFLIALETQASWWRPAWVTIGWWIGALKIIGGFGFLLGACFGFNTADWSQYMSALCTLLGAWAFMIASLLLWYECAQPFPVLVKRISAMEQEDVQDHAVESDKEEMATDNANSSREALLNDDGNSGDTTEREGAAAKKDIHAEAPAQRRIPEEDRQEVQDQHSIRTTQEEV